MPSRHFGKGRAGAVLSLLGFVLAATAFYAAPSFIPQDGRHRRWLKSVRARVSGASFAGEAGTVLQVRGNDCGAACLKAILDAHGIRRSLSELTGCLKPTAEGTSMLDLRLTAGRLGLPARSWIIGAADLVRAPLPAIAFIGGNHFVVIRRLARPGVLEVDDPALGRLQWPVASFRKRWSGETLVFDPSWVPSRILPQVSSKEILQ